MSAPLLSSIKPRIQRRTDLRASYLCPASACSTRRKLDLLICTWSIRHKWPTCWYRGVLGTFNKHGSMKFVAPATSDDSFFPEHVDCSLHAANTLCQVKTESVTNIKSGAPVRYALQSELTTDSYQVVTQLLCR